MTQGHWQAHVASAAAAGRIGDLLLLADEAPRAELRGAVWQCAATLLRAAKHESFARELEARAQATGTSHENALACPNNRAPDPAPLRHVLLFSGHMVDAPGRAVPRFPADKVPQAAQRIAEAIAQLDAGPADIALTQGACGGDLLFSDACLKRGVPVYWLQPFAEPRFLKSSVQPGGDDWLSRYRHARAALAAPPRAAPEALGEPPSGKPKNYAYERCNRWLLYTALSYGADKLVFVCLWNGADAEGPGGTAHMAQEVRRQHGRVVWIDSRML